MRAGSPIYHLGVLGNKLLEVSGLFGSWIWTEVARVTGLFHNIVPAKLRNTTIYALDWIAEHLVAKGSWHSMSHESLKYAKYNSSTKQSANWAGHQLGLRTYKGFINLSDTDSQWTFLKSLFYNFYTRHSVSWLRVDFRRQRNRCLVLSFLLDKLKVRVYAWQCSCRVLIMAFWSK